MELKFAIVILLAAVFSVIGIVVGFCFPLWYTLWDSRVTFEETHPSNPQSLLVQTVPERLKSEHPYIIITESGVSESFGIRLIMPHEPGGFPIFTTVANVQTNLVKISGGTTERFDCNYAIAKNATDTETSLTLYFPGTLFKIGDKLFADSGNFSLGTELPQQTSVMTQFYLAAINNDQRTSGYGENYINDNGKKTWFKYTVQATPFDLGPDKQQISWACRIVNW